VTKKWLFVGSKTQFDHNPGRGIYTYQFDSMTGSLTLVEVFEDIVNPTFLMTTQDGRYLYSVIEVGNFMGEKAGGIAAFSVHPKTAKLTLLNCRLTGGASPCHVRLDRQEKVLFVSNYNGGSVAVFPIAADGSLEMCSQLIQYQGSSVHPNQQQPHAHAVMVLPDNRYVFTADLGTDVIHSYTFDTGAKKLVENYQSVHLMPGAGPRHFALHPHLSVLYVVNELDSTVVVFDVHKESGYLTPKEIVTSLPAEFVGQNSAADIHVTHNGKFLYASNRGHDSLAIFTINAQTGELESLGHQSVSGKHPRNFMITPDDNWLLCANRDSDNIVSFRLNTETGMLTHVADYACNKPICLSLSRL